MPAPGVRAVSGRCVEQLQPGPPQPVRQLRLVCTPCAAPVCCLPRLHQSHHSPAHKNLCLCYCRLQSRSLLKVAGTMRRAHGDPFRLIDKIPYLKRNFNYSMRLVAVSASVLLLGLHYFACGLWLVLRVQVRGG